MFSFLEFDNAIHREDLDDDEDGEDLTKFLCSAQEGGYIILGRIFLQEYLNIDDYPFFFLLLELDAIYGDLDDEREFYCEAEKSNFVGNEDLFRTFVELHLPISHINKIINVLRCYSNPSEVRCLPQDFRSIVGKYPEFKVKNIDVTDEEEEESSVNKTSEFIYFGIKESMRSGAAKFDSKNSSFLQLNVNIDGLPIFNSSRKSFWPILGKFGSDEEFPIALYYGLSKPKHSNKFLKDFVDELIDIYANGAIIGNKIYNIRLGSLHFDSPARSFALNSSYFNAYDGCFQCKVKGVYLKKRMSFLDSKAEPRTNDDFLLTELSRIPDLDLVRQVILDAMHVIDLGVMRKLMTLWLKMLVPSLRALLSERLKNLYTYTPQEFQRKCRSLDDVKFFKAKEYRALLLYTGPVVLRDILPSKLYDHFLSLHMSYRILNDETLIQNNEYLDYVEQLLNNFVHDFALLYGEHSISFNVHALTHIVDDVRKFQRTLISLSSYPYEDYLGQLGSLVRSAHYPARQVARRIHEMNVFKVHSRKNKKIGLSGSDPHDPTSFRNLSMEKYFYNGNFANQFCQVDHEDIFFIHHFTKMDGQDYAHGIYLKEVASFFDVPCESKSFNIVVVTYIPLEKSEAAVILSIPVQRITGKYYIMPVYAKPEPKKNEDEPNNENQPAQKKQKMQKESKNKTVLAPITTPVVENQYVLFKLLHCEFFILSVASGCIDNTSILLKFFLFLSFLQNAQAR